MITSLSNSKMKEIQKLQQKKYRDQYQRYLVEGEHLVEEAFKHHQIDQIIYTGHLPSSYEVLPHIEVSEEVFKKLSQVKSPQHIMAVCQMPKVTLTWQGQRYLLLEDIQDPGNAGTLVRSALAFGYDAVIFSHHSVDLFNDKYLRASQGACFQIPCIKMDLKQAITSIHQQGGIVYGTALHQAQSIETYQASNILGLILGNEGQGMSQEIMACCDHLVYIPISGAESLNVAIAGSIAMFYFK